jgi:hypothetical protein
MARQRNRSLSADVKTTAYLKFRRIFDDAVKARELDRALESRLILGRCLLHVPPLLAAAGDTPIPDVAELPEWVSAKPGRERQLLSAAFSRSSDLSDRFAAAGDLHELLRRRLPQPTPIWESGRMRFARSFSSDTLFFAESNLRVLRWWDRRRDRGELKPGLERFLKLVRQRSPQSGCGFHGLFLEAFQDTPGLCGIIIFGSSAHADSPWNQCDGKDVDLAILGRGLWFRRALCARDGIRLDILRVPEVALRRGVKAEDDLMNNALSTAEILRDDSGEIRLLQKGVQDRYAAGKTRPRGEDRESLEHEMMSWAKWGEPRGDEAADLIRLEAALAEILKRGFRLNGQWFPSDQDLIASLEVWTPKGAGRLRDYLIADNLHDAYRSLGFLCEVLGTAGISLSDRARASAGDRSDAEGSEPHSRLQGLSSGTTGYRRTRLNPGATVDTREG